MNCHQNALKLIYRAERVLTPPPPSEQPGPVTEFKAQKTTKSSISLSWKKPVSDGGSFITAYVLELSEGEDKWRQIHKGKEASHTLGELTEGQEYTFRVKALNESGEGPPTELTVMAKDQFGENSTLLSSSLGGQYALTRNVLWF